MGERPTVAFAQSAVNLAALRGLAPFSALLKTASGRMALEANYSITAAIQSGSAVQPLLIPLAQERAQALRDTFITSGNAFELADGLGSKLGAAYQSVTGYSSVDDGKTSSFTSLSPDVATVIAYANAITASDSNSAKFFFANETVATRANQTAVSSDAAAIMTALNGTTDVYGKAYQLPAGSKGSDPYGDSRPFQTEQTVFTYSDPDYFGVSSSNVQFLKGPNQDLIESPSFPSGHTTYGYTESLMLGFIVPQRYPEMIARAAEYGNDRIIVGAHYAMDVIAGRTLAYYDVAHLLAGASPYAGAQNNGAGIADYQGAVAAARGQAQAALESRCGENIALCARDDTGRFAASATDAAFYESTQTYGLPVVYQTTSEGVEPIERIAPEAGYLLTAAFPKLTLMQADRILTQTEGPGGGFLDNGSAFGVYSRLDLYKAGQLARSP